MKKIILGLLGLSLIKANEKDNKPNENKRNLTENDSVHDDENDSVHDDENDSVHDDEFDYIKNNTTDLNKIIGKYENFKNDEIHGSQRYFRNRNGDSVHGSQAFNNGNIKIDDNSSEKLNKLLKNNFIISIQFNLSFMLMYYKVKIDLDKRKKEVDKLNTLMKEEKLVTTISDGDSWVDSIKNIIENIDDKFNLDKLIDETKNDKSGIIENKLYEIFFTNPFTNILADKNSFNISDKIILDELNEFVKEDSKFFNFIKQFLKRWELFILNIRYLVKYDLINSNKEKLQEQRKILEKEREDLEKNKQKYKKTIYRLKSKNLDIKISNLLEYILELESNLRELEESCDYCKNVELLNESIKDVKKIYKTQKEYYHEVFRSVDIAFYYQIYEFNYDVIKPKDLIHSALKENIEELELNIDEIKRIEEKIKIYIDEKNLENIIYW